MLTQRLLTACLLSAALACAEDGPGRVWDCQIDEADPAFAVEIGCMADFERLAAEPFDASIPGARTVKTVIDRIDGALYFQNSKTYPIHWEFARAHLSANGRPFVQALAQFNDVEYYSPDRRFILGAVTLYEGPNVWTYEIAPYDTATADMITQAYERIRDAAFFGEGLRFHPTSQAIETVTLPDHVAHISSDELFAGTAYQPLNLAHSIGRLRFVNAADLETQYLAFRDVVVLDRVPNDISVVSGIITSEFQTPLSHINVLSQNRGTPNMAYRGAMNDAELRALEGKWVRLVVEAFAFGIEEVSQQTADAWWDANKPSAVQVPQLDLSRTDLTDLQTLLDPMDIGPGIQAAIPSLGGKASNYAALTMVPGLPVPHAFAIPVYYYDQFMQQNGFYQRMIAHLQDPAFNADAPTRDAALQRFRDDMLLAPVDPAFEAMLLGKLQTDYPDTRMRFRSSTNAEDLDGFTGAGLYTSKSGDLRDPNRPVLDAVRKVWASVWKFRAFEERSYRSISHVDVGMAILVHHSFPDEEANGVALTANPFDTSGLEPGFYVNVQAGESSVVKPDPGITTDQFVYQFDRPGQPIIFYGRSNLTLPGQSVLTPEQTFALGQALDAIHRFYLPVYGPPPGDPTAWYAMDVEFKFDDLGSGAEPTLWVKQARPHPGRGE